MTSAWQFYLDDVLTNDPIGFDDAVLNLERDPEIDGLFVKYTNKLTWYGPSYDYIKAAFRSNFCDTIKVDIMYRCKDGTYDLLFRGILILSDMEFDEQNCTVIASIEDDSFSGKITRNKSMLAKVNVALSKNAVAITPVTASPMTMFTVSTGVALADLRDAYKVSDCLRFLIDFMTDGTVGFVSDYFTTGYGKLAYLMSGKEIRTFNGDAPTISFKELFVFLNKKFNISFSLQVVAGQRVMRIENKEYFYSTSALMTLPNVPNIMVKVDKSKLYANVKVGNSNTNSDYPALSFPSGIRFLNWKDEKYHVLGDCSVDTTLDLVDDLYIDSNSVEDILVNASDGYDDKVFCITSDNGTSANKGDPFGTAAPYFYNRELMNDMVIPRWLGGIPNSIAAFLGNGNDEFYAEMASDTIMPPDVFIIPPAPFPVEISDPNNRYDNALYKYTAPENGLYYFKVGLNFEGVGFSVGAIPDIYVTLYRINASNVTVLFVTDSQIGGFPNGNFTWIYDKGTMYMDAGDYVIAEVIIDDFNGTLKASSWFECETAITGGGIFAEFETKEIRPIVFDFVYPVTYSDFKSVIDNYAELITFYKVQNNNFDGWLEKIVYPVKTGLAQWTIISKKY